MAIWEFGINKPPVKLRNRFLVEKLLGAGGLGETYRALDERVNRSVVLKVLNAEQQANADACKRFKQEAEMLAKFQHQGVVTIYDLIEVDDRDVIVMELIDGYDLLAYMRSTDRWRLPEAEALSYVDQAAEALEYVHQQGLLHRDIKPQNIMRCANGRVKLIDFGLAKQFDPNMAYTNTGGLTEGYAPIEQYEQRGKFTNALDVYALAATLYHLLTGEPPLRANQRYLYSLIAPQQVNPPPQVSDAVNAAIMQGLELEPLARPQEVISFRKLLKAAPQKRVAAQPVVVPKPDNGLKLESFTFQTAQIKIDKGFFGGTKIVIDKSAGQAKKLLEDLGGGVQLEMVQIPAGEFLMGSASSEKESRNSERPQHKVTVPSFYLGRYPVTQAQYAAIMGNNPSHFKGDNLPVEKVIWHNAQEFCQKLMAKTKKKYRLPSEAEWEYACRAGTTTPFYFGETIDAELANYDGNYTYGSGAKGKYLAKTNKVGSFPANNFGLCDMPGNVWEWCEDGWHNDYNKAPVDGTAWKSNDSTYVLRGGS
jgi:formylglycine-generating enzyme required for sulfatase activity/predicted Ser/Thr protein kinase